jgi:superfamily II DNA or RNA helicase
MSYGTLKYSPPRVVIEGGLNTSGAWIVECEPHVTEKLKRWFKQVRSQRTGALIITATREASKDLLWIEYVEAQEAVERVLSGERLTVRRRHEPAREPRDYQLVAADIVLSVGRLLLIDDLGLGKTFTGLLVLRDPRALPAVVVCPTHLQRQWLRELGFSFPMLRGHIVTRASPTTRQEVRGARCAASTPTC